MWIKEEEPKKTKYEKLLELKNLPMDSFTLQNVLLQLSDVCFFNEENPEVFRNREFLKKCLCSYFPTLDEFYRMSGNFSGGNL